MSFMLTMMAGLPGIRVKYFRGEKVIVQDSVAEIIDEEWLALICEAKKLGLTIKEVQHFLYQNGEKENS